MQKLFVGVYMIEVKELWIKVGGVGGMLIYMMVDVIELYKGLFMIWLDVVEIKIQVFNIYINLDNG